MGTSYGGYAAIWGAMRSPQRYRCAISFAGPTDLRRMLRYDARFMIARRYAGEWRRRVEGEERTDLDAVSPAEHPADDAGPLLIAHGEQDITVPVDQTRRLLRALQRRGANVEFGLLSEVGPRLQRCRGAGATYAPRRGVPRAAQSGRFAPPRPRARPRPAGFQFRPASG